jgi:hypothetical protein
MASRARRGGRSGRVPSLMPSALASLVGAAVLVGATRAIDAGWRRTRGMSAAEDGSMSGRLLRASLLGAVLSLATRLGLPDEEQRDGEQRRGR